MPSIESGNRENHLDVELPDSHPKAVRHIRGRGYFTLEVTTTMGQMLGRGGQAKRKPAA